MAHLVLAFVLLAGLVSSPRAETVQIYDGMTRHQLAEFARRQGWRAEVSTAGTSLTIHVGDRRADVTMFDCAGDGRCNAGIIRDISYYFIKSPRGGCDFWHWNLEGRGATGFGPNYVSLQRYVQFRGVTDRYLRDAIEAWLAAAPSFWKLVEECYDEERRSAQPKDSR